LPVPASALARGVLRMTFSCSGRYHTLLMRDRILHTDRNFSASCVSLVTALTSWRIVLHLVLICSYCVLFHQLSLGFFLQLRPFLARLRFEPLSFLSSALAHTLFTKVFLACDIGIDSGMEFMRKGPRPVRCLTNCRCCVGDLPSCPGVRAFRAPRRATFNPKITLGP